MLADFTLQESIVLGGLLIVIGYFYFRRLREPHRPARVPFEKLNAEKEAVRAAQPPVELLRWQVEMHETARDMKAEIDTKMVALQTLIRSAREEEERLLKLLAQVEQVKKL